MNTDKVIDSLRTEPDGKIICEICTSTVRAEIARLHADLHKLYGHQPPAEERRRS